MHDDNSHYRQTRALPSAITLGKEGFALGKAFAECCTRQRVSAYPFTAKASLPSAACRALGKAFAECRKSTRQRFTLGKMKMRKNPKIIANFFSGEAATGQRPSVQRHRPSKSLHFLRKIHG